MWSDCQDKARCVHSPFRDTHGFEAKVLTVICYCADGDVAVAVLHFGCFGRIRQYDVPCSACFVYRIMFLAGSNIILAV